MQASETKQIRKRQSKKPIPQLIDQQSSPIDEVLHAPTIDAPLINASLTDVPIIDQSLDPISLTQLDQEKIELRGRPKKYSSLEEAERIATQQLQRAQQKYRIQRQEFRTSVNDLQLLLIRRLQKTIIYDVQDLLQISQIIDRSNVKQKCRIEVNYPCVHCVHGYFKRYLSVSFLNYRFYIISPCVHGVHGGQQMKLNLKGFRRITEERYFHQLT
ncbi:MAG: hypothetical protein EZS28_027036 [Streblomastix strix]|uniref:Uncharacterized protein n=1 Tax=Streblomastix strix TaxID=222440 RepID=A0A5J4V4B7_9EUKA|nr:MAG: hypothetical protein EZS28_027036 [Streblomastix strix]